MISAASCQSEIARLNDGPRENEAVPGVGIARFLVECDGDANDVLSLAKSVMKVILIECAKGWPEEFDWRSALPQRFVSACSDELTPEEAEQWLQHWQTLSDVEREAEERDRKWSLDNWLHWLQPKERAWQWWDAKIEDANRIEVGVAIDSWPFGWGAITWLFRGSGAADVVPIDQSPTGDVA